MDYDDIDKIAESLTDNLGINNGLVKGISMHEPPEQVSSRDYDIPSHYATKHKAKSVTLLEMNGYRCITAKQKDLHNCHPAPMPAPAPAPAPIPQRLKPTDALKRGTRTLEL